MHGLSLIMRTNNIQEMCKSLNGILDWNHVKCLNCYVSVKSTHKKAKNYSHKVVERKYDIMMSHYFSIFSKLIY